MLSLVKHRQVQVMLFGTKHGFVVTGIGVAEDPHHWIVCEDALQSCICCVSTVGNNHHARVLTETNSHATTMVETHP